MRRFLRNFAAACLVACAGLSAGAEMLTRTNAIWSNIGNAYNAGSTDDGTFDNADYKTLTIDLGVTKNIALTEIGDKGAVKISTIVFLKRTSSPPTMPTTVTATQTGGKSVTGTITEGTTQRRVYASDYDYRQASGRFWTKTVEQTITFADEDATFDTTKPITLTFPSNFGVLMIKKPNGVLGNNETWCPAVEVIGDYSYAPPCSISINFGNQGQVTGTYGVVPSTAWFNVTAVSNTRSDVPIYGSSEEAQVAWSCKNLYQYTSGVTDTALKGYLDDGGDGISIEVSNIPFACYDVIIYQATDSGSNYAFNPPSVNGTYYSFDGKRTSATRNDTSLKYGQAFGATATTGRNVIYLKRGFTGECTIKGAGNANTARGCIAAIQIVEAPQYVYATQLTGDTAFSAVSWMPDKTSAFTADETMIITNAATAALTFDTDVTAANMTVVSEAGCPLAIKNDGVSINIAAYDFSEALGGVTLDASGLDGTELAKNAVAGAPYSHWILRGALQGGENVAVTLPTMPSGYEVEEIVDDYGVRVVVTAPKSAKFGSVSINVTPETSNDLDADVSYGLYPDVGSNWGFIRDSTAVVKDGVTFTPYVSDTVAFSTENGVNVDQTDSARIMRGLCLDKTDGRTVGFDVTGVENLVGAAGKCRVIVYMSTDSANRYFAPVVINGVVYAGPTNGLNQQGYTIRASSANRWGATGGDHATHPVTEGVNAVISDVLDAGDITIRATRQWSSLSTRASIAAVQVMKVGQIAEVSEYKATVSAAGTYNLTDLTWSPSPFVPTSSDNVKVTIDPDVMGEVVINLDKSGMAVNDFQIVSKGEATVKLTGSNPTTISTWDFSSAKGRVAFGFEADYSRVTLGTYPCIGIAYLYTGTITNGFEYLGTGNALTLTTISGGTVIIGGSGTLHGDLDLTGSATVMFEGVYTSPDDDVELSCSLGQLTIAEGADISVSSIALNRSGIYGGLATYFTVNGKVTVTSECDSDVYGQTDNHKGVLFQKGWSSDRGIVVTVNKNGSLIAPKSWIMLLKGFNAGYGDSYGSVKFNINGGMVNARGIDIGPYSYFKHLTPVTVQNGGTLQLSEGVLNQDNGRFSINDGTLSAYSYNSSTGYTWSPTNTTVSGTVTFDANGLALAVAGDLAGSGAKVVATNSAANAGSVTLKGIGSYAGGTAISPDVTLKLGNAAALGTGAVAVGNGATLDYAGFSATNALTVAGALVNSGSAVQFLAHIDFTGDASIGGSGGFSFLQSSDIDLGGHTLTLNGAGTVKLGGFTVTGGGAVVVTSGILASNGATALEDIDLSIAGGKLDLSGGNSISCRDFASSGTITGAQATLIVSGTLDAQKAVTVPKLTLKNNATLNGVNLTVTSVLKMEDYLHIIVPDVKDSIKVATVPSASSSVTLCKYPYVNGLTTYTMAKVGTGLYVNKGTGVIASISLDSAVGWTNFQELKIEGGVGLHGQAFGHTNINAVITSTDGTVTTQRFDYAVHDGKFSYTVTGLDAGKVYDVSVFLSIEGAEVQDASSETVNTVTARAIDWIDEDVYTFAGYAVGTGDWNRNGVAGADTGAGVIRFAAEDWSTRATFSPTNDSLSIRSSRMKDIRFKASFARAGFLEEDAEWPDIPADREAAVTMVAKAEGDTEFGFAVATNGAWCIVDRNAFPAQKGTEYEFLVHFDYDAATVTYSIETGKLVRIATSSFDLPGTSDKSLLEFAGAGTVETIVGTCYDANLMLVGDTEYGTLDDARAVAGETHDIVPLWKSRYSPSDASGRFNIVDTKGYLDVAFAKWYHYVAETDGKLRRVYRYIAGNNWIEYADEAGVEPVNGGWRVMNEAGLAWIAESATNDWFDGSVTLGANLDLSSKNWTPVARFTGSFDGQGYTIRGLNNTNVVESDLLGEAGHYFAAPTNDWGYSAYGLFGCATNAAFINLTLADVAISNTADSVAALLGVHAGGDLTVRKVVSDSGYVRGEGRAVAGLLTVGGNGGPVGDVTVTANANHATIVGALADNEDGGNVAQILAGTTWGTTFGSVVVKDNEGDGTFDVSVTNGVETAAWGDSHFNWLDLPICNFAPAVIRTDENLDFWRFVEANESESIPVDPVKRTARMLAGLFENGWDNIAGWWVDTVSAAEEDGVVTIYGTDNTLDVWNTIAIDRSVTIDLNGNCAYGVYDCNVFDIADGKTLTLKNGVVYYAHGYLPTNGVAVLDNVKMAEIVGDDLYARTVPLSGLDVESGYVTIEIPYSSVDFKYIVDSTSTLAEDWTLGAAEANGTGGKISIQVPSAGDSGFYRVRIERTY